MNAHIPFFKAEVVRTGAYDVQLGGLRTSLYLDGPPGVGKTDLIELICDTMVSFDKVQFETAKALTTEATNALTCHAMSEITPMYSGKGPDGVDPVMKELLSSGFASVRTFHQEDKDPMRRLRATGALFLVSLIAAGNDSFLSFPAEVRQRWMCVYVSGAQVHPEAPTHELKDGSLEKDREAYVKVKQELGDENAWCALAMLVLQTKIGGYRWNMDIADTMIAAANRCMLKEAHYVKVDGRKRKQLTSAIKHWSLVNAVQYHTNGFGALASGRITQPFNKQCVFDILEMATCPTEEIVAFVLSLYADENLDLRTTNMLSRLMPACKVPRPVNFDDLSVRDDRLAPGDQPQYFELSGSGKFNYNYQKVPMTLMAAITHMESACRGEFTHEEIRHIISPEPTSVAGGRPFWSGTSVDRGVYAPTIQRFWVRDRDESGRYKRTLNTDSNEFDYCYISAPSIMVKSGGSKFGGGGGGDGCFYILTEMHNDINRDLFLKMLTATCNVYTKPRPYKITLGIPYIDSYTNRPWPNVFATWQVTPTNTVPHAFSSYTMDERTYQAVYKNIGVTRYVTEMADREAHGSAIEGELELLVLRRHLGTLYTADELKRRPLYAYWAYQVHLQKLAVNFQPGVDADDEHDTLGRLHEALTSWTYATDTLDPSTGLYDFAYWTASHVRASRARYEEVINQDRESLALGSTPVDRMLNS